MGQWTASWRHVTCKMAHYSRSGRFHVIPVQVRLGEQEAVDGVLQFFETRTVGLKKLAYYQERRLRRLGLIDDGGFRGGVWGWRRDRMLDDSMGFQQVVLLMKCILVIFSDTVHLWPTSPCGFRGADYI